MNFLNFRILQKNHNSEMEMESDPLIYSGSFDLKQSTLSEKTVCLATFPANHYFFN